MWPLPGPTPGAQELVALEPPDVTCRQAPHRSRRCNHRAERVFPEYAPVGLDHSFVHLALTGNNRGRDR